MRVEMDRLAELRRTAALVRAAQTDEALRTSRRLRPLVMAGAAAAALAAIAAAIAIPPPLRVSADAGADADLFSLTNQDRASNGLRSLRENGTLGSIGEGAPYHGCGFTVDGRSVDMIQRNYFAHPIQGCGQYVFSIMQAYGVHYLSAGENIGWNNVANAGSSASSINVSFMNSPEHRSNILNSGYTDLGIGSAFSGTTYWTGAGTPGYQNVWMFSEEFAQLGSSAPPQTPPPPGPPAPRNSPPPPPPAQPQPPTPGPTQSAFATPEATLTPLPSPTSAVAGLTLPAPPPPQSQGLLVDSVESVLESFLDS